MWGNIGVFIPIVAIAATAWVIAAILRYKSQALQTGAGAAASPAEVAENVRLARENEELRHVIGRLEQRLQVLERIATDPAERTAREIESLR